MENKTQYQIKMGKNTTFIFKNKIQEALWKNHLLGQISDGWWENTLNTGYTFWINVNTLIGTKTKLEGTHPGNNVKFNFGFVKLIKYTLTDMLDIGRKFDSNYSENKLKKDLTEISVAMKKFGNIKKDI